MRTKAILDFCAWIEQTRFSNFVQTTPTVVPAVQTIHILAIAAVLASAMMINLRLLGIVGRSEPLINVSNRFRPVIWWALPILLITGMVMIAGEPARSLANAVFQLKMLFLISAIGVTLLLLTPLGKHPAFWEGSGARRGTAKLGAIVSVLLWIGIVCAGRWIAYT